VEGGDNVHFCITEVFVMFLLVVFSFCIFPFFVPLTIFTPFPQDSRRQFTVGIRSVEVEKPLLKMNIEET
jgi:hypothetical protein